ncbi:tubulin-dependent ATPase kip3 [Coemansia sp. IMI 203386]|nr:tubulin-dependent ATPase kip3 [Coemansia sp. IMI 203386]
MLSSSSVAAPTGPMGPETLSTNNKPSSEAAILVAVRVRPFNNKEKALLPRVPSMHIGPTARNFMNYNDENNNQDHPPVSGTQTIRKVVHPIDDHVLVFDPPDEDDDSRRATMGASNKRYKDIRFVFDRVYGEESTQRDLYEGTTRGLLDSVMNGYNATVFAYGATGCGKTYTISGCPEDPGVIFLTMQELFERLVAAEDEKAIDVTVSYLEVYNETIRDLLGPDVGNPVSLALREDAQQGVTVIGLSEHVPKNVEEVMQLMVNGNANRTMSPTEANAVSSRSHAVLQVNVRQRPKSGGLQTDVTTATLSIIDLAGSERATVARNNGTRKREGANINRSLLALANCINALCDQKTKRHIPYRDSKLTRLLKFSLGGNCRTVMITCVSPASTYYEETHNTLKYANRAKNIKTTVAKNTKSTKVHLAQYQGKIREQSDEIKRLQREIALLKSKSAANGHTSRNTTNAQAAQAMAELRKQTQAIQVVQDMRNRMAQAYAPIRDAQWEFASTRSIGQWFDHHAEALKGWREQFETLFQEHEHLGSPEGMDVDVESEKRLNDQSRQLRQQVDDVLRELTRQRKQISRHFEHSEQTIERKMYEAQRAAQVPPSVQLTAEQRYQVDQEHRVLDLSAERIGLRRQAELSEHVASDLAKQNTMLLRLAATCMFNLKRAQQDIQRIGDNESYAAAESAKKALDQVYLQAISTYGEVTRMVKDSMNQVKEATGPSKLQVDGSTLTPPSPYVMRTGFFPKNNNGNVGAASSSARGAANGPPVQSDGQNTLQAQRPNGRNPNAAAISAAVAGTTRARRTTILMPPPSSSSSASNGRSQRVSPNMKHQQHLNSAASKSAVRFNASSSSESGRHNRAAKSSAMLQADGGGGNSANMRSNTSSGARRLAATAQRPRALRRRNSSGNADTIAAALSSNVTITSPTMGRVKGASVADTSSISLPSPTMSTGSVGSPASSIASWVSAESSPHHEPLPAAARPVKGILKGAGSGKNTNGEGNNGPGPVRLGSIRGKSKQARNKANPTARITVTPTKPPTPGVRELTFKSLASASASTTTPAASTAFGSSQVSKKASWTINK